LILQSYDGRLICPDGLHLLKRGVNHITDNDCVIRPDNVSIAKDQLLNLTNFRDSHGSLPKICFQTDNLSRMSDTRALYMF
jgi:hypothetical protein